MTPQHYMYIGELNTFYDIFLANVNADGKHLRRIKKIDIQQCLSCLPIKTAFWLVANDEMGRK